MLAESELETPRPSSLSRMLACPASRRLAKLMPPKPSSTYADEGSAGHRLGEICLTKSREPFEFYGQGIVENGREYRVNNNMAWAVSNYVAHVRKAVTALGADAQAHYERKLYIPEIENGGTVDCVIVSKTRMALEIHDYKHGSGVYVPHAWNAQFIAYGLGAARAMFPGVDIARLTFTFTVHQPRFEGVAPARAQILEGENVAEWRDTKLIPGLARARERDAPFKAGDHCMFCPCKNACPEYLTNPSARGYKRAPISAPPVPAGFQL